MPGVRAQLTITAMPGDRVYCPVCSEVIGVYEPAVVVDEARTRETSLAREPSLRTGEQLVLHRECAVMSEAPRPS